MGISCGRSLMVPEFGAGSSPRRMASSRPVATRRPSRVQTLCTAKPRTTTVTRMKMVTPRFMATVLQRSLLFTGEGSSRDRGPKIRVSDGGESGGLK